MAYLIDDDTMLASLNGSHSARYALDVFYDDVPIILDLPVTAEGSWSADGAGQVQTNGSIFIRTDQPTLDRSGRTFAPDDLTDALAPAGQEVVIKRIISIGSTEYPAVVMARLRITGVPTIDETRIKRRRPGQTDVIATTSLELELQDQFERLAADSFTEPTSPLAAGTVWSEIRRICPLPVQVALADADIKAGYVYPDSRLDAITELLRTVGGVPHLTREGTLTARLADPMSVPYVAIDLDGTIQDQSNSLSNDFHNHVVVTGSSSGSRQLVGEAKVIGGTLSVYGPFGNRVRRESAQNAATQSALDAIAAAYLAEELASQVKVVKVTGLPRLDIELGDVVKVTDPRSGRTETGQVSGYGYSLNPTDLMTLEVSVPQTIGT